MVRLPPVPITTDDGDKDDGDNDNRVSACADELGRHFDEANNRMSAGDNRQAARHLRIANTFLKFEASHSSEDERAILDTSIRELQDLAQAMENNQKLSRETLRPVFARAHYALSRLHYLRCAQRCGCTMTSDAPCCGEPTVPGDRQERVRASYDLKAAAMHLQRGALWDRNGLDEQTRRAVEASQRVADDLIREHDLSANRLQDAMHALHGKLEHLTRRTIQFAPPIADRDAFGPSVVR